MTSFVSHVSDFVFTNFSTTSLMLCFSCQGRSRPSPVLPLDAWKPGICWGCHCCHANFLETGYGSKIIDHNETTMSISDECNLPLWCCCYPATPIEPNFIPHEVQVHGVVQVGILRCWRCLGWFLTATAQAQ